MGCSNCFNGCADIVSDQCVKYTGINIPGLEIVTGDPLSLVESKITDKILELISGEGVIPVILPEDLCSLVSSFLPVSDPITLNDVISALFRSICDLDSRLVSAESSLTVLNANYVIDCLTGVTPTSGTHDILQAAITKLCQIDIQVDLITANILSNYVLIADIDSYIASYLASIPSSTLINAKMVPYAAMPYFGPTAGIFDITGAGIGSWIKVYLCNGQNLTPDLRGRTLAGATTMGNTPFDPAVDPSIPGNPSYDGASPFTKVGANQAFLTSANQLAPHTHSTTVTINDPQHSHNYTLRNSTQSVNGEGSNDGDIMSQPFDASTSLSSTGLKGNGNDPLNPNVLVTIGTTGSSLGHPNIQPTHSANYIIYIP